MSDVYADAADPGRPIDLPDGVIRLPIPSTAFVPFPSDVFRTTRRLAHVIDPDEREHTARQLVAQALEELGRAHLAALPAGHGMDCPECWWLSKALAPARAAGWLR